jgi:hypothetical protein
MAEEYTTVAAAADATLTMVEDGDALTAASVRAGMEETGDAVERLQELVNPGESDTGTLTAVKQIGFGEILYLDPTNGTIDTFGTVGQGVGNVSNTPAAIGNAFTLITDITCEIPDGATLTQVAVLIAGGTTSGGVVPANMPRIRVFTQTMDETAAAPPFVEQESQTDTVATQALWQAKHWFSCAVSPGLVADRGATGRRFYVDLRGEYGANVTQSARYLGFRVSFSYDIIDPVAA